MKRTIAFDLDATLAHYTKWEGLDVIGDPLPGAVTWTDYLISKGYDLVVYTTRTNPNMYSEPLVDLVGRIQYWLREHGFNKAIRVEEYKPIAMVYVDDRGLRVPANGGLSRGICVQIMGLAKGVD